MARNFKGAFILMLVICILLFSALGLLFLTTRTQTQPPGMAALKTVVDEAYAALEARNVALERDLSAFRNQGTDQSTIISEHTATINRLETDKRNQEQAINRLENEIRSANNSIAELTRERDALLRRTEDLQRQVEAVRALLQN